MSEDGQTPPHLDFGEFSAPRPADWLAQQQKELKGRSPDGLGWILEDGTEVPPYPVIHHEITAQSIPMATSWLRGAAYDLHPQNLKEVQALIEQALQHEVQSCWFSLHPEVSAETLEKLLAIPGLRDRDLVFSIKKQAQLAVLSRAFGAGDFPAPERRGSILQEMTPEDLVNPNHVESKLKAGQMAEFQAYLPAFRLETINGRVFQEAGADTLLELTAILAQIQERLQKLASSESLHAPAVQVVVSSGRHYLIEIAKFRALRLLYAQMLDSLKLEGPPLFVYAFTAQRNITQASEYNNLIRATLSATAAVVGGCDALVVTPFDVLIRTPDAFSHRMARNIQHILYYEAFMHRVQDPAAGAYYIEHLTRMLVERVDVRLKALEQQGGFMEWVRNGKLAAEIQTQAQKQAANIAEGSEVVVGVNAYTPDFDPEHAQSALKRMEGALKAGPATAFLESDSAQSGS